MLESLPGSHRCRSYRRDIGRCHEISGKWKLTPIGHWEIKIVQYMNADTVYIYIRMYVYYTYMHHVYIYTYIHVYIYIYYVSFIAKRWKRFH